MVNTKLQTALSTAVPEHIGCVCPSCERATQFHFCGTQTFPVRVAVAAGLPSTLYLYTCNQCGTTISYDANDVAGAFA